MIPPSAIPLHPDTGVVDVNLYLEVNGVSRQSRSTKDMIWKIPQLIQHISSYVTLEEWDVILTGTPDGVGEVCAGDKVTAGIEGLVEMQFEAVAQE